nr:MFS transporter [Micromonospora sp. NBC_00855]
MTAPRTSWLTRIGVPNLTGYGKVTTAVVIDTIGVGLMLPISLLYFTLTTDISPARLGAILSAATLLSLPAGLIGGALTDRFGPRAAMVLNNAISGIGYLLYLVADDVPMVFTAMLLVAIADRMYWACWSSYVHQVSNGRPFERWFAFLESVKAGCMGLASLLSGLILAASAVTGARSLVIINVVTCFVAALLFLVQRTRPAPESGERVDGLVDEDEEPELLQAIKGWRSVLSNPTYLLLALGQALLSPILLLPTVMLPLLLFTSWDMPVWVASLLFGLNTGLAALMQVPVSYGVRRWARATTIWVASVTLAVVLLVLGLLPGGRNPLSWVAVVVLGVVLALVDVLYMPPANALVTESAPEAIRGRTVAVFHTASALGVTVFPAIVGLLVVSAPGLLWPLVAASTLAGAACFSLASRRMPRHLRYSELPAEPARSTASVGV